MMADLLTSSSVRIGKKIAAGQISSREVVESVLERIREVNPKLNAVDNLNEQQAMATATKMDEEINTNGGRSPIHGVPMTIKDSLNTLLFIFNN